MDPQTCTIILLKQTNPFYISDHDDAFDKQAEQAETDILQKSFGHGNYYEIWREQINKIQIKSNHKFIRIRALNHAWTT